MKRIMMLALALFAVLPAIPATAQNGNGAPSGPHYNLNVIGVARGHTAVRDPNQRHTIFVPLSGQCDIGLTMGAFQVTDWSCMDGDRAEFSLPNPDDNSDGVLDYSVWVRARGNPTGSATLTTCFLETSTGTEWCNAGTLVVNVNRIDAGKFVDVSRKMLQVCADVDPTAGVDLELVPLFSALGSDYWWHMDNNGQRVTQLRFYPLVSGGAVGGDCTRTGHPAH